MPNPAAPSLRSDIDVIIPDIEWITIPAGNFYYGLGEEQQEIDLEEFAIGKYPITNQQYQCFIDDGGYRDWRWWEGLLDWNEDKLPQAEPSHWPQPNRPKTNLNWYEANAFCRWLSDRTQLLISLPTEQQWEKAAVGDSREDIFPWEAEAQEAENLDGFANIGNQLEQTSTVGLYPKGNTAKGVADLSGNIWEWCANPYENARDVVSTENYAALRGGGWFVNTVVARARGRFGLHPGVHDDGVGFRILRLLPYSDPLTL